jgi:hypothetical protein
MLPDFNGQLPQTGKGVYGDRITGLFFCVELTVLVPMPRTRPASRIPLPFIAIPTTCSWMPDPLARQTWSVLNIRPQPLHLKRVAPPCAP